MANGVDSWKADVMLELRLSQAWDDDDPDALRSLYLWLLDDRAVSEHASVSLAAGPPVPGTQGGGAFEFVQLAADTSLQLGALVLSYATWRRTRPGATSPAATATLTRGDTTVVLEAEDPEALARLVAALEPEVPEGGAGE
ncbi:effector-associated constant component EACC1 [Streptomyces anulatus]|uniref:effector-associated constant component EACC1 n=1 Tax=Streptomyces anulatus TaxID=1892 RepID=UPI0036DA108D